MIFKCSNFSPCIFYLVCSVFFEVFRIFSSMNVFVVSPGSGYQCYH